jgi:glycosyltransferase involved in cell wall biosynthesis
LAEKGESFGVVPLEAMARGCPAVVSNLACFRDYLTPEESGFVFDHRGGDAASLLAALLERILSDERLRVRVARAGYETSKNYSLEKIGSQFLADFKALMASP